MKQIQACIISALLLLTVCAHGEELGLKASHNLLSPYAVKAERSSGEGIHKGLMQFSISFNMGGHGPVARRRGIYDPYPFPYRGVSGFRPGMTLNFDYAVHKYVSVGGYFGLDGGRDNYRGYAFGDPKLGVAFGVRTIFHIYQLIADKANTKADPGKLDFYFPFAMGGIIYRYRLPYPNRYHYGGFHVGAGLGLRYYFARHFGILMELGWLEMSAAKIGFTFKF
jgi:hypothetical protein